MNKLIDFGVIMGELHTAKPKQTYPNVDDTHLYDSLIFKSPFIDLKFRDVTGPIRFTEEHITTESDGQDILYAPVLETEIGLYYKSEHVNSTLYQTDIGVRYVSTQDQFYILTQFDFNQYGPVHFWYDENLYKIHSSWYDQEIEDDFTDPFFNSEVSDSDLVVENIITHQSEPVPKTTLQERLNDNPDVSGALPLASINGDHIVRTVKDRLSEN